MTDTPDKSKGSAALRLLQGIAMELRDLAEDTARFGETLSSDVTISGADQAIGLLQEFDIFSQSLRAHALLIDDLSAHIETDADDISALHDLIGHIPFFGARERLRAKLSGAGAQSDETLEECREENWFGT
ncbi:MAG: hypothetical protein WCA78_01645 [Rhizomicrobium sp.]|jgi:hypothetical protein